MRIEFANPSSEIVFIGSGYMHGVFRQGEFVYKCVKPEFMDMNTASHFETERYSLGLLRRVGFPTPSTCDVIPPGAFFKEFWALRENYMEGHQYRDGEMPRMLEAEVCDSLLQMAKNIVGVPNVYGRITPNDEGAFHNWRSYLCNVLDSSPYARKRCPRLTMSNIQIKELIDRLVPEKPTPCFVAMDTNLMNFFFDHNGKIAGIIDVDRPVWGDLLYLYADIRWNRDHWFHRLDWYSKYIATRLSIETSLIDLYEFIIAYEDIDERYRKGKSHSSIDDEMYLLDARLKNL